MPRSLTSTWPSALFLVSAPASPTAQTDSLVRDLEDWTRAHLTEPVRIEDAAYAIGTTRRTLERHMRERLGMTPLQLVQQLRIERAQHLRRTTEQSMEQIARAVGYRSATTLQRLLRSCRDPSQT